ncbi:MAG: hypothetical protein KAT07_14370 [Calditrichia bacterium]|nr:hypothetical protein [Calditrichia bacterium]
MIPKIIHQSWKSKDIPDNLHGFVETWRKFHPDWEYRLWTDDDNRELVRSNYKWLLPTYDSYSLGIQRADMARILYLHKYGGLYVDLDFECFRPFDELMEANFVFLGREKGGLGWYKRRLDYTCNALLASPQKHPFWELLLKQIVQSGRPKRCWEARTSYVLSTTGPQILDLAIQKYLLKHKDLIIYPQNYFYPARVMEKSLEKRRKLAVKYYSFAVHHFNGSWLSPVMHLVQWLGSFMRTGQNL